MPYLRVETNVAASKADCIALAKKLTGLLEGVLGKPAQYISVSVIPDMALVSAECPLTRLNGVHGATHSSTCERDLIVNRFVMTLARCYDSARALA